MSTPVPAPSSFALLRRRLLIGLGWAIVGLGVLISPLPGPAGLPVAFVGGMIVMRHSPDSRRLFVRMKRRHPRILAPFERIRATLRRRRQRRLAAAAAGQA